MDLEVKIGQDRAVLDIKPANILGMPLKREWEMPDTPVWSTPVTSLKLTPGPNTTLGLGIQECMVEPSQPGTLAAGMVVCHANIDLKDGSGPHPQTCETLVEFIDPNLPAGIVAIPRDGTNAIIVR